MNKMIKKFNIGMLFFVLMTYLITFAYADAVWPETEYINKYTLGYKIAVVTCLIIFFITLSFIIFKIYKHNKKDDNTEKKKGE